MSKRFNLNLHEEIINEIDYLETLVELTRNFCLNKEFQAIYYDLSREKSYLLSKERNHYINVLNMTLKRLNRIKEIDYNKTPTIAADK